MKLNYLKIQDTFNSGSETIDTKHIINALDQTNIYISELCNLFLELNFDLFEVLGQRNLSGVIGEIYSRFFCLNVSGYTVNPHPDGRPDILNLNSKESKKFFKEECFSIISGKSLPLKSPLTPYKYNGIEIKCTVGSPRSGYKKLLERNTGKKSFDIGDSRIEYLSGFNFWAHHQHSTDLLSLYYDYHPKVNKNPQILAAFFSNIEHDDWHKVSLGSKTAKKTSNTSLNTSGKTKLYSGLVTIVDDETYINKFKKLGIKL